MRVPEEFVAQVPEVANPPTLFLPIVTLARSLAARDRAEHVELFEDPYAGSVSRDRWLDFLARAWPRLHLWFNWFDRAQAGSEAGSYRCCLRMQQHCSPVSKEALQCVACLLFGQQRCYCGFACWQASGLLADAFLLAGDSDAYCIAHVRLIALCPFTALLASGGEAGQWAVF
jgi:hypothetical protein